MKFLREVARIYATNEREALERYCFVFPNKRSATFFNHYLEEVLSPPALLPVTMPIAQLVEEISIPVEASRFDRLFILFQEYEKLSEEPIEFERFLYWGEMLLNDFDDVDRNLVDAESLFVNVKRFREIRSHYLTPEQLDIIGRYWDGVEDYTAEVEDFWEHTSPRDTDDRAGHRFVKLWEVLGTLYHNYHDRLESDGYTSPGMLYRNAARNIESDECPLAFERYVFIGFNVLSASELKLFELLKKRGMADFYWELPSKAFQGETTSASGKTWFTNKAMTFMARNIKMFPSKYTLSEENDDLQPSIEIIGVPSRVGEAKKAGDIVAEWSNCGFDNPENAINTAIVLPDENLFVTTMNSIPLKVSSLNVTMGYPMKRTPVATFMKALLSLQLRARESDNKWWYFYEDIQTVISHTVAMTISPEETQQLAEMMVRKRRYMVEASMLQQNFPRLAPIFIPISNDKSLTQVSSYVSGVLDLIEDSLSSESDNEINNRARAIYLQFATAYRLALENLICAATNYGISMGNSTAFKLVEKAIASQTVAMKGEPLKGLQIMGVLETRALDFDNVIITSMNERVFPKKSFTKSFIPEVLRKAYRLSTLEHQEAVSSYYFYRLISHARRVKLIYDARTVGGQHNEMSRFLVQLLYTYRNAAKVKHSAADFIGRSYAAPKIVVSKDKRIRELLEQFITPGSGKNLSASAINNFIDCPLQFYLRFVEGLDAEDELVDYIDASTYGSIVHQVLEQLYLKASVTGKYPVTVTKEHLERWAREEDTTVHALAHSAIDSIYLKLEGTSSQLLGETKVYCEIITRAVKTLLRAEIASDIAPFRIIEAEKPVAMNVEVPFTSGRRINLKMLIDRVDEINLNEDGHGHLRIVDYKTGIDATSAKSWEQAFDESANPRPKALVQLFIYANTFIKQHPEYSGRPLTPLIYSLRSIPVKGIEKLKIENQEIEDYRSVNEAFLEHFGAVIERIFSDEPFCQTSDVGGHACTFCKFKTICGVSENKSEL